MRLIVLSVLMTFCVPLGQALAQDAKSQAKAQYKKGAAHLKNGEYTAALNAFEAANRLAPHPVMLKNIAKVYRKMNDYGKSIKYFQSYLRESKSRQGKAAKDESKILQRIAEMRATRVGWPSLRLESSPAKADVRVNDPNGPVWARTNTTLRLPPGKYVLYVSKSGYGTDRREFLFEAGTRRKLRVTLTPNAGVAAVAPVVRTTPRPRPQAPVVTPPPVASPPVSAGRPRPPAPAVTQPTPRPTVAVRPVAPSSTPEPTTNESAEVGVSDTSESSFDAGRWGMITMIAGGALVVGGISMGAVASQTSGNLDTCRTNPACHRTDRELGIANDVRSQALVADILWATGSAVVVTGAVLYFVLDSPPPADSVSGFQLVPMPGGAAATAGFRF